MKPNDVFKVLADGLTKVYKHSQDEWTDSTFAEGNTSFHRILAVFADITPYLLFKTADDTPTELSYYTYRLTIQGLWVVHLDKLGKSFYVPDRHPYLSQSHW